MKKLRHREDELRGPAHIASKWQSWNWNAGILPLEFLSFLLKYTYTKAFSHVLTCVPSRTYCHPCHMRVNQHPYLSVLFMFMHPLDFELHYARNPGFVVDFYPLGQKVILNTVVV